MQKDHSNEEMVDHPAHYKKDNPAYEPYRVIREWKCNFNIGSAIKYLSRYKDKWNPVEDLEKAIKYIEFEIDAIRREQGPDGRSTDEIDRDGKPMVETTTGLGLDGGTEDESEPESKETGCSERIRAMRDVLNMTDEEIGRVLGMSNHAEEGSPRPTTRFTRLSF